MKNQDKISFAINQIPINNCDGSANEKAIKAVRYLQEVHEALSQVAVISSVCDCDEMYKTIYDRGFDKCCRSCGKIIKQTDL